MPEKLRQMLQHISALLTQYNLGIFSNLSVADGGFTNENYIVETSKGKFFLKKYLRQTDKEIRREHTLLSYLKEHGFPVPGLIKNNDGTTLTQTNDGLYTFYDYIGGHTRVKTNNLTDQELKSIAHSLARYHYLSKNMPLDLEPRAPIVSRQALFSLYGDVVNILKTKAQLDEFDLQINNILAHKINELNLLPRVDVDELPSLLVHGDFHAANMKFNDRGDILAVFDWELSRHQPRIWEVLCAMAFACKQHWAWNFHTPIDFIRADIFLTSYHAINPLTQKELESIPSLLQLASADLSWPLREHYIYKNFSSDRFLPNNAEHWFFWDNKNISRLRQNTLNKLSSLQSTLL